MKTKIERRVRDRDEEAASRRWVWKVIVLALVVTAALYFFLAR